MQNRNEVIQKYYQDALKAEDGYESFIFLWIGFSTYLLTRFAKFTDSPSQALENFVSDKKYSQIFQEISKDESVVAFQEFLQLHYDTLFVGVLDLKYAEMFYHFMMDLQESANIEEDFNKKHFSTKYHKIGVLLENPMSFYNYMMLVYQIRCNIFHKGSISLLVGDMKRKEEKLVWLAYTSFSRFCEKLFRQEGILI